MTSSRILNTVFAFSVASVPAIAAPAASLSRLKSELTAGESATAVLTRWCANLNLADPAIVRAERDASTKEADGETRALLKAGKDERIGYRRVKLVCGSHVLSEADNWYLPDRLTAEMNRTLETTDTPFGAAVRALKFHRKTLEATTAPDAATALRIRALLLTPAETPFSLVIENYRSELARQ